MSKEKYKIMRDRELMLTPGYWNSISHTSSRTKELYGVNINVEWFAFANGRGRTIFLKKDWNKKEKYLAGKFLNDKSYFARVKYEVENEIKRIEEFFIEIKNQNFSKFNIGELLELAEKIKKLWLDYDKVSVLGFFVGGDRFKKLIGKKLKLPQDDFLFLTTPIKKTAVSQFEYELLKYAKLIKEGKRNLEKTGEKLADEFGWIPFGYDGLDYWNKNYFIKKLKTQVKSYSKKTEKEILNFKKSDKDDLKKRNVIINKFKLNKSQLRLIEIINVFNVWTDERKKLEFKLHYYYSKVLLELEKKYNIPYKNLKYLFTGELKEIAGNKKTLLLKSQKRIKNSFMLECKNGKYGIISKKQESGILKEIKSQNKQENIKGMVASKGVKNVYSGKVKILLSPKEGGKVKNGDFLVATMTTPDYIMPMKKAAGFITDEGGVTCHAAIIAREMNKPCVIGTGIATKVLRDGDLVEVDANKGVVKILKRK